MQLAAAVAAAADRTQLLRPLVHRERGFPRRARRRRLKKG
jgi:hypothetical protein